MVVLPMREHAAGAQVGLQPDRARHSGARERMPVHPFARELAGSGAWRFLTTHN